MWSNVRRKIIVYEDPIIIDQYKKYFLTHYIGEDKPMHGCLSRDDWPSVPLEQFCRFIREKYNAIKVVGFDALTEDEFQLTYYLNHKYDSMAHDVHPRYLLGKYGEDKLLFKPISFDLCLVNRED